MHRIKKYLKWFLAGAIVITAARSGAQVHQQAEPLNLHPIGGDGGGDPDPLPDLSALYGWGLSLGRG